MAQRNRDGVGRRRGLRGLGGRVGRPQMLACVVGLALLLAFGVWRSVAQGGFSVERGGDQVAAPAADAGGTGGDGGSAAAGGHGSGEGTNGPQATGDAGDGGDVAQGRVVVHVDGAVASPGVYELALADPRVGDAVKAAGGLAPGADTTTVNLAAKVADGSKVHVPLAGEQAASGGQADAGAQATSGQEASSGGTGSVSAGPSLVNINTATAEELDALPGVGPSTAQAIVEDRERNGPFSSPEDLMRVSGIGEKKFAKLEGSICV